MRKAREGIEQGTYYPEPAWITARPQFRFWYRFLLGRPMDGQRWSDSTFWRPATRGEDHWWLRLAGWQRAAFRLGALHFLLITAPLLLAFIKLPAPWSEWAERALLLQAGAIGALLLPALLLRLLRSYGLTLPLPVRSITAEFSRSGEVERSWSVKPVRLLHGRAAWEREVIRPLARTAAAKLGRRYHPREARQWVHVPRDFREPDGGAVEILLPQSIALSPTAQKSLANACAERLGIKDVLPVYELEGSAPRLLLRAPVLPPTLVTPADVRAELERSAPYTFVLGRSGAEVLTVSLKEDSPHMAVSAGSGAGKSEWIKDKIAQALHWGWSVIILDWKGESQEWCEGLPGVRYVRQVERIHDMMIMIGEEIEHRRLLRDKAERDALPRILVVSEEWNITAPILADYWTSLRQTADPEERRTMPTKSPAIVAGMKLNFTGRSLGFSQLLVAQRFSARVTNGNADLRESFGFICMSRWKSQTVKMLAPDIKPFPKKITAPGRWVAVNGDEAVVYQSTLWTDEEAREWATSGEIPPASPWSVRGGAQADASLKVQASTQGVLLPVAATTGNKEALEAEIVDLAKLVDISSDLGHLRVSERTLREWRDSDPNFPQRAGGSANRGWLYDRKQVALYARKRRAQEAAESKP